MAKIKLNRDGDYFYIGKWQIGHEYVELLGRQGEYGGSFTAGHSEKLHKAQTPGLPFIVVGLEEARWRDVCDVLLHETLELALYQQGCRFEPSGSIGKSHASYLFSCTHEQFGEAVSRSAYYITPALPELCDIWKAYKNE